MGRQARFVQQLPNAVLYAGQLKVHASLLYYQPNGYLYLNVNGYGSAFNAGSLFGKNVMVALRCASGICSWRVGADTWKNAAVGTTVDPSPLLLVGSDYQHYRPFTNNVSSLFWVYGDALTDAEVDANFQYAGSTLASRGASLDGYTPSSPPPSNTAPTVSLASPTGGPFTAPASINLVATASDSDGSVQKVDFLANGSLIGTATSASSTFSYNWTGVPAGDYSIVARATDNIGATTDSAPVTVSVGSASAGGPLYITRAGLLHYAFNEGTGTTVYDAVGGHNGTTAGSASWTSLGLKGGWVNSGVSSFSGNKLSAVSGDAFTVLWVGKLDSSNNYQTLFSMQGSSKVHASLLYYQPNGYLYLNVNGYGSAFNAGSLFGKNVMVALRCASGICSWRVGADTWKNAAVGTTVDPSPLLLVGSDYQHYRPFTNNVSSLFWVYGDALTDAEVDANFQYAGSTLASRGASLDGYVASGNSSPTAQSADMTIAQDRYGFVYLRGSDPDGDSLTYSVTSGPAHGTLEDTAFPFKYYQPEAGWTGTDHIQFEVRDSYGHSATGAISITVEPYQTFNTAISTADELFAKLRFARPGETVVLAPGVYTRPVFSSTDWGLRGVEQYPIVFRAQDPANPPTIDGSLVLAGSSWLRFENLRFVNPGYHNVNVYPNDAYPSHDIVFDGIYAESKPDLTLAANLKITRSDNVDVRNSTFFGWGDNSIDTIGLWGGVFEDNQFLGRSGFAQRTALQLKGDSRDLIVRNNYFFNAGQRVVQIGGGTGAQFFREPPSFEAQRVEVYGNRIVGGGACFSLATQTDSNVHHNTCYLPSIWIIRLLNENGDLEPNQNGRFEHNLFVYDSGINPEFVNLSVLGGVDVASFVFHNNAYFQVDGDSPSLPALPVVDTNMVDQINPELVDAGLATMAIGSANPAFVDIGADVVNP
ncbi:MAG: Ig-like domain-containing protein [Bryobacterales bacterium]